MLINPEIPGKLTRIAVGNVGGPRVSGDGSTVVYQQFVNNQWDVLRCRDGKTEVISDDSHNDVDPQVSDDGDAIVWSRYSNLTPSNQDGNFDVLQWRKGVTTPVAATPADEMDPAISGDGSVITWTYDNPKLPIGFDIQELKDGKVDNVTTDWPVDTESIANRDGSRVFFRRKIHLDDGDMWVWDRQSGTAKQLTFTPTKEYDPAIDASGHLMAWSNNDTGDHQLLEMDVDSGKTSVIAAEPGVDETHASLSTDGAIVVYERQPHHHAPQIYLHENGKDKPLTLDGWNEFPSMSRDGRVITWWTVEPDGHTVSLYRFDRDAAPSPSPPLARG